MTINVAIISKYCFCRHWSRYVGTYVANTVKCFAQKEV